MFGSRPPPPIPPIVTNKQQSEESRMDVIARARASSSRVTGRDAKMWINTAGSGAQTDQQLSFMRVSDQSASQSRRWVREARHCLSANGSRAKRRNSRFRHLKCPESRFGARMRHNTSPLLACVISGYPRFGVASQNCKLFAQIHAIVATGQNDFGVVLSCYQRKCTCKRCLRFAGRYSEGLHT